MIFRKRVFSMSKNQIKSNLLGLNACISHGGLCEKLKNFNRQYHSKEICFISKHSFVARMKILYIIIFLLETRGCKGMAKFKSF